MLSLVRFCCFNCWRCFMLRWPSQLLLKFKFGVYYINRINRSSRILWISIHSIGSFFLPLSLTHSRVSLWCNWVWCVYGTRSGLFLYIFLSSNFQTVCSEGKGINTFDFNREINYRAARGVQKYVLGNCVMKCLISIRVRSQAISKAPCP